LHTQLLGEVIYLAVQSSWFKCVIEMEGGWRERRREDGGKGDEGEMEGEEMKGRWRERRWRERR